MPSKYVYSWHARRRDPSTNPIHLYDVTILDANGDCIGHVYDNDSAEISDHVEAYVVEYLRRRAAQPVLSGQGQVEAPDVASVPRLETELELRPESTKWWRKR